MKNQSAVNYASYLQLDQILGAQSPRSNTNGKPEHDELLFIIIHQSYELWFKQILHEFDYLVELLAEDELPQALATLRRILTILKTIVAQIDILETMTPLQFNSFRGFLESSSGFQSVQFRELEFALGYKRKAMLAHFSPEIHGFQQLEQRFEAPSLWDAFLGFLARQGHAIPAELLERDVTEQIPSSTAVQDILVHIYRTDAWVARLCERLVDFDEGLQEWRYRHVKMVARTIGNKQGTGGSTGVQYLATTVKPIWPDLWAIRAEL